MTSQNERAVAEPIAPARGGSVSIHRVARWFINNAVYYTGEPITRAKLQKLVYYAQAWYLANFDSPLFPDDFEAWAHGPVNLKLRRKYRDWEPLEGERGPVPSEEVCVFLGLVYDEYGRYSAKMLEDMTHEAKPWKEARGDISPIAASSEKISKLTMRNFYAKRLGREAIEALVE
ncbi:MAG: DUF4065 domain-containing protein [Alphaproteobacteria bacterium]|nr:DUF4065 domain-containing protein [Alphaproteobacteria bacterium]